MQRENTAEDIANLLRIYGRKRILITTHMDPDGDALGSLVALGHILSKFGADVRVLFVTGVPDSYSWLAIPWPTSSRLSELNEWVPNLLVLTDCGDAARAGAEIESFFAEKKYPTPEWSDVVTLNIDHHQGNPLFATYNLVEPAKAATAEIIGDIANVLDVPFTDGLGEAIYLGLVTDTGHFSFANTTATVHSMVASILASGLNISAFTERLENNWSIGRMQLWGKLITDTKLYKDGAVAVCSVSLSLLQEFGATKDDLEGLGSWLRRIKGVRVTLLLREDALDTIKISLRSMGDIDIRQVAVCFAGGGHRSAAGATYNGSLAKCEAEILERLLPLVG